MAEALKPISKVLMVSDHKTTGPLFSMGLQQNDLTVILETSPKKAVVRRNLEVPDIILLDLQIPNSNLLELVKELRTDSTIPILLLTSNRAEDFLLGAYEAGVDECIEKPIGPSLFLAKVKVWLQRGGTVALDANDPLVIFGVQLHPAHNLLILENGSPIHLTNLETRLLYCLMGQPGRVVKIDTLIQRVWGSCNEADSVALKNIVYRLRKKIENDPANPRMVVTISGIGYQFGSTAA